MDFVDLSVFVGYSFILCKCFTGYFLCVYVKQSCVCVCLTGIVYCVEMVITKLKEINRFHNELLNGVLLNTASALTHAELFKTSKTLYPFRIHRQKYRYVPFPR